MRNIGPTHVIKCTVARLQLHYWHYVSNIFCAIVVSPIFVSLWHAPDLNSLTFHSRLKTYLFHNHFHRRLPSCPRTDYTITQTVSPELWRYLLLVFFAFLFEVSCCRFRRQSVIYLQRTLHFSFHTRGFATRISRVLDIQSIIGTQCITCSRLMICYHIFIP